MFPKASTESAGIGEADRDGDRLDVLAQQALERSLPRERTRGGAFA